MPFYRGKTVDGSDAEEVTGGYINPDNENEWSSVMYPKQRKWMRDKMAILAYMDGKYTLRDVYQQIKRKECPLSRNLRECVLSNFDSDGEFVA